MKKLRLLFTLALVWSSIEASQERSIKNLWSSSTRWMRSYLTDSTAKLPRANFARKQFLATQKAIGTSIKTYYGEAKAQELTRLLEEQAKLTLLLIDAVQKRNTKMLQQQQNCWKVNAIHLSKFLSLTNPYLSFTTMQSLLYDYLNLTINMIQDRVSKRWKKDIQAYEAVQKKSAQIGKKLTKALSKAFPPRKTTIAKNLSKK